jgi:hypothetical protein
MAATREICAKRVEGWRASGLTAAEYGRRHRLSDASLKWWRWTVSLFLETSPTDDDVLFQSITGTGAAVTPLAASNTPTVVKMPMLSATVPISRYLRWRLASSGGTWDATFRILVAANSPGM